MLVLVVGNINSGKSHAVRLIQKILPEYPVLSIDEYRKKYGDGTIEAEVKTRERFVNDVAASTDAIVELSGMGPLGTMLESIIPSKRSLVIHVAEDVEVCLSRLACKDFSTIPYPTVEERLEDTIVRIDHEIKEGSLHHLWNAKCLAFITVQNDDRIDETLAAIPFLLYEKAIRVFDRLNALPEIREIVLYGSIARGELTPYSDIDMMVTSTLSLLEVEIALSDLKGLTYHDTPDGKITLYFGDLLVEVVVVKQLCENAKYYAHSNITDVKGSILKGDKRTSEILVEIQHQFQPDIEQIKSDTLKRLVFFIRSLPGIARKDDVYKYFFHVNIIIHELVCLERIARNDLHFLYLPKQVVRNTSIRLERLIYTFGQDYAQHQKNLNTEVNRMLKRMLLSMNAGFLSQF